MSITPVLFKDFCDQSQWPEAAIRAGEELRNSGIPTLSCLGMGMTTESDDGILMTCAVANLTGCTTMYQGIIDTFSCIQNWSFIDDLHDFVFGP